MVTALGCSTALHWFEFWLTNIFRCVENVCLKSEPYNLYWVYHRVRSHTDSDTSKVAKWTCFIWERFNRGYIECDTEVEEHRIYSVWHSNLWIKRVFENILVCILLQQHISDNKNVLMKLQKWVKSTYLVKPRHWSYCLICVLGNFFLHNIIQITLHGITSSALIKPVGQICQPPRPE